jgi:hypothetical protein
MEQIMIGISIINLRSGKLQAVPRHREINEILAKRIIKDLT